MSSDSAAPGLIYLVGFMGCGKTTVGSELAAELGYVFVDLDDLVIASAGMTIAELIERRGEPEFRAIETRELTQISSGQKTVIALGGGAYVSAENREIVEGTGISVWLDAPFELCWERIVADTVIRPLAPGREIAEARFESRRDVYSQSAVRVRVEASKSVRELAREIISHLC